MNWHLIVKYLHIVAVTITIGGMFARQLVRSFAKRSDDVKMEPSGASCRGDHRPRRCGIDGA